MSNREKKTAESFAKVENHTSKIQSPLIVESVSSKHAQWIAQIIIYENRFVKNQETREKL